MTRPPLMRPVLVLAAVSCLSTVALAVEGEPPCFCLMNPVSGDFLWGCREATPPGSETPRAYCYDPETGEQSIEGVPIQPPWLRSEEGTGNCVPCGPAVRLAPE